MKYRFYSKKNPKTKYQKEKTQTLISFLDDIIIHLV